MCFTEMNWDGKYVTVCSSLVEEQCEVMAQREDALEGWD